MQQFDALLAVAEKLLGPKGCPWDQKQTFASLQPYVLEEAHEVIEAVDLNDEAKMKEELGDLLYTIVFYAKLGEKEGKFTMAQIVEGIQEKLIRRHPHVFGELKVGSVEEVVQNWERIKKEEKKGEEKRKASDGIPPTLPTLLRAQKVIRRLMKTGFTPDKLEQPKSKEAQIGHALVSLIAQAAEAEIDIESALRRALYQLESL